jgi:hypothetical protein
VTPLLAHALAIQSDARTRELRHDLCRRLISLSRARARLPAHMSLDAKEPDIVLMPAWIYPMPAWIKRVERREIAQARPFFLRI